MSYLILILLSVVVAYLEATDDNRSIDLGKPIDHKAQVFERMLMLGLLLAIMIAGDSVHNFSWEWHWRSLLFIPICWAAFTISFRWMLNRMRGLDWRYISPSNKYDFFFFWIGSLPGMGMYFGSVFDPRCRKEVSEIWVSKGYHAGWQPWIKWAHRGGTIAYAFELFILTLSTWGYFTL